MIVAESSISGCLKHFDIEMIFNFSLINYQFLVNLLIDCCRKFNSWVTRAPLTWRCTPGAGTTSCSTSTPGTYITYCMTRPVSPIWLNPVKIKVVAVKRIYLCSAVYCAYPSGVAEWDLEPEPKWSFLTNISYRQFGGCQDEEKPPLRHISYITTVIVQFLSGNIWHELGLEPEPKLWTKVEPESELKINNFGSALLREVF